MYSRLRTSLKQRGGNKRKTLKQRGGYGAYATPDAPRNAEWIAAATGTPLATLVTALCTAPTMQSYIEAVAKQDDLFLLAHRIVFNDLITGDTIDIPTLLTKDVSTYKGPLSEYLNDVRKWVCFTVNTTTKLAKIEQILKEPMNEIILYPQRLTNTFVAAIAGIFVQVKQNAVNFSNAATFAKMKEFYTFDFNGYSRELTYKQTRKDVRDGFYLEQAVSDFKGDMKGFWSELIDSLKNLETTSLFKAKSVWRQEFLDAQTDDAKKAAATAALEKCRDFFFSGDNTKGINTWAPVAASVFDLYTSTASGFSIKTLLEAFYVEDFAATGTCETDAVKAHIAEMESRLDVPPTSEWDNGILGTKTTFTMLMTQMDTQVLEFMLHLTQKITEVASPAPAPAFAGKTS